MENLINLKENLIWNLTGLLKNKERHTYHLVDNSQLPFISSVSSITLVMSFVFYFHFSDYFFLVRIDNLVFNWAWTLFSTGLFAWFLMVVWESGQGYHTSIVRNGLKLGMLLFIISEVMFFFAFFWAFFHVSLSPAIAVGGIWPPKTIQPIDVWGLPLVNTLLLLSSGLTITLAHHALLHAEDPRDEHEEKMDIFGKHLGTTVLFGAIFLLCQGIEYKYGLIFRWKESVYGSTFYATTGFHGFHVTLGTVFLLFCFIRIFVAPLNTEFDAFRKDLQHLATQKMLNFLEATGFEKFMKKMNSKEMRAFFQGYFDNFVFKTTQHLGFEASAWYWHFVDVVWIFLFITVYWWGN